MDTFRKFGPKTAGHPSVGNLCPICKKPFEEGDYTTLVAVKPASADDAEKMAAGKVYNAEAIETHYDCEANRIAESTDGD